MKHEKNRFCTCCLSTRTLFDYGDHYICEYCKKKYAKGNPAN